MSSKADSERGKYASEFAGIKGSMGIHESQFAVLAGHDVIES